MLPCKKKIISGWAVTSTDSKGKSSQRLSHSPHSLACLSPEYARVTQPSALPYHDTKTTTIRKSRVCRTGFSNAMTANDTERSWHRTQAKDDTRCDWRIDQRKELSLRDKGKETKPNNERNKPHSRLDRQMKRKQSEGAVDMEWRCGVHSHQAFYMSLACFIMCSSWSMEHRVDATCRCYCWWDGRDNDFANKATMVNCVFVATTDGKSTITNA